MLFRKSLCKYEFRLVSFNKGIVDPGYFHGCKVLGLSYFVCCTCLCRKFWRIVCWKWSWFLCCNCTCLIESVMACWSNAIHFRDIDWFEYSHMNAFWFSLLLQWNLQGRGPLEILRLSAGLWFTERRALISSLELLIQVCSLFSMCVLVRSYFWHMLANLKTYRLNWLVWWRSNMTDPAFLP